MLPKCGRHTNNYAPEIITTYLKLNISLHSITAFKLLLKKELMPKGAGMEAVAHSAAANGGKRGLQAHSPLQLFIIVYA